VKSITVGTLLQMMKNKESFQLIDVREEEEHLDFNIGGQLMPMEQITSNILNIATDKPAVFYCRKGIRSQFAIQKLMDKFPFTNLVNLIGGTEAWKREIDQFGIGKVDDSKDC
jgi:adenylyltransferase/sulfurtransferase